MVAIQNHQHSPPRQTLRLIVSLFHGSSCVCGRSLGAQRGAGQTRRDPEVSPEEAAVRLGHRRAAAEDGGPTRRPAAAGRRAAPLRGGRLADVTEVRNTT